MVSIKDIKARQLLLSDALTTAALRQNLLSFSESLLSSYFSIRLILK